MNKKIEIIEKAIPKLRNLASPCNLCRHRCLAEREKGKWGICRSGVKPAVYSYSPHYGEEPPLSGKNGSGTIFFTHCNMKCIYCQNYAFSQEGDQEEIETERLSEMMLELQDLGCYNVNLVSPTHHAYQIVEALKLAIKKNLNIPIVYNTGGYDTVELIKLLDGIIDIYLVDMRYAEDEMAEKYSYAPHYVENNRLIVKEMFRQAGVLKLDSNGIAQEGVIVRLLILPNNVSGTINTLRFLKEEVSKEIFLSVMSQYYPIYNAANHPIIGRRINEKEYNEVIEEVDRLGFTNGWVQGFRAETERFLGTRIKKGRFDLTA